jgi:hypothetical protein
MVVIRQYQQDGPWHRTAGGCKFVVEMAGRLEAVAMWT